MTIRNDERATLAGLADVLVPAGDGMPSASQAGVSGEWLDAVLASRPELAEPLQELLRRASARPPHEVVAELRAQEPALFAILAEVVPGAYFMNPAVRAALNYGGQNSLAIDPRPDYMEDDLLASVIRRGPIYRPTPK